VDKLLAMTTFVRIVDKGSLTAAANALDTSLPTVVRTLAALERQLGVSLLNRTTRRIHLTDAGARYLERCRVILSEVQDAEAKLSFSQAEPQGRLAVTASVLFGRRYVAPIVSEFIGRHRDVNVEMLFVDRLANVVEEGLDVAVRIGHLRDSSLGCDPDRRGPPRGLREPAIPSPPRYPAHAAGSRAHVCVRHMGTSPRNEWNFRIGRRAVAIPITCALVSNEIDSTLNACVNGLGLGTFLSYQTAPYRKSTRSATSWKSSRPSRCRCRSSTRIRGGCRPPCAPSSTSA